MKEQFIDIDYSRVIFFAIKPKNRDFSKLWGKNFGKLLGNIE